MPTAHWLPPAALVWPEPAAAPPLVNRAACSQPLTASLQSSPCTVAHSSSVVSTTIVGPSMTLGGMLAAAAAFCLRATTEHPLGVMTDGTTTSRLTTTESR